MLLSKQYWSMVVLYLILLIHTASDSIRPMCWRSYLRWRLPWSSIGNKISLSSLAEWRGTQQYLFIHNISILVHWRIVKWNNWIFRTDLEDLFYIILYSIPQRSTRITNPFTSSYTTINYLANQPLRQLLSNANVDTHFKNIFFWLLNISIYYMIILLHNVFQW